MMIYTKSLKKTETETDTDRKTGDCQLLASL